ncbi:vacuolar transporter chaperone [Tieghemiomyces parasiticus]|uniref:Vacuolar transporter chaperone n=1 Tax=Tieghemiomyces parasiticus TaxID=78921 RepID=A0A9W8DZR1_9FUNG|nr:vacuolar transporter chaperone [Tieghemiomyces parasiticus]
MATTEPAHFVPERSSTARRTSICSQASTSSSHRSLRNRGIVRTFQGLFRRSKAKLTTVRRNAAAAASHYGQPSVAPSDERPVLPKNFFANERTFIHWVRTAVMTGGVGLAILNFNNADTVYLIPACLFVGFAVGLMIYSLYQFWVRADRLTRREPGYYDDRGAVLVVLLVMVIGVGIHLAMTLSGVTSPN